MPLTSAQKTTLKAFIAADPVLSAIPNTPDGAFEIADRLALDASPDFWVYKTTLNEHDITGKASVDATTWSWSAYIPRSQGERDGWARMFNDTRSINPSLANVRQGLADIFSGTANNAPAQRTHLQAMSRRKASVVEKLFATGTGSTASPATMVFEGRLTYADVQEARNS
jgi:hypothetical protein